MEISPDSSRLLHLSIINALSIYFLVHRESKLCISDNQMKLKVKSHDGMGRHYQMKLDVKSQDGMGRQVQLSDWLFYVTFISFLGCTNLALSAQNPDRYHTAVSSQTVILLPCHREIFFHKLCRVHQDCGETSLKFRTVRPSVIRFHNSYYQRKKHLRTRINCE